MLIFSTFFILGYKVIINSTNINNVLTNSTKIPAFILIYSPYCPHCTKVHPDWEKLMDQYSNDTKVIVAECNAIAEGESCRKIFNYKGFPSFIAFTRRRGVWLRNIERTLPSFVNETERLKKIDLSFPCPLFETDFTNDYPAIIFNTAESKEESCETLQRVEKLVPDSSTFLYVGKSNETGLIAKLTESNKVIYNGDNSDQSYADFIHEYSIKQFETHEARLKYTEYKRKIVLLIYNQPGHVKRLQTLGEDYFKDIIFTTYFFRSFNRTYPQIQVTPLAAIVSNQDKTKFALFNNMSTDANSTQDFLKLVKNNNYDAKLEFASLFPTIPRKNQRINIVNPPAKPQKTNPEQKNIRVNPPQTKIPPAQTKPEKKPDQNEQIENEKLAQNAKEIYENNSFKNNDKTNSKFVPVFLFVVGLVIMVSIGIFAYCKIKGKNIAKIE